MQFTVRMMVLLVAIGCLVSITLGQETKPDAAEKWQDVAGTVQFSKPWKDEPEGKISSTPDGNQLKFSVKPETYKFDFVAEKFYILSKDNQWISLPTEQVFQRNRGSILIIKCKDQQFRLNFSKPYPQAAKLKGVAPQESMGSSK